ncbi:MAG: hypothetical protein IT381_23620 [Deltaproteobacteria bacterium]|nr:hypothetical protein [Deltaproteobacteria bacterium]
MADPETQVKAKVLLGTLITLYDDLADDPRHRDSALLETLYQLPFRARPTASQPFVALVDELWACLMRALVRLPHYPLLAPFFAFDVERFYAANRYCELVSDLPCASNQLENRTYVAHNMGIIIAGMIDLMATPVLHIPELGRIRALFYRAQEFARLSNVRATTERELRAGDLTSEISAAILEAGGRLDENEDAIGPYAGALETEQLAILSALRTQSSGLQTFDGGRYVDAFVTLNALHFRLQSFI